MYKRFNDTIKSKLTEKNKSLRELCREAGIDASFLSKVLKNKRNPPSSEKILFRLARALEVNPLKLVLFTGKIPEKYYDLFCSDKFIDWISAGEYPGEKKPAAVSPPVKKQFPAEKTRRGQAEMSEELL